jgi:hypothetical protein
MSDICKVANGCLEWKIGSTFYVLSQLTVKELKGFTTWARNRRIKESLKDLEVLEIDTPENRYKIMKELPRDGDLTSLMFDELLTAGGLAYALCLSINKKAETKVKYEDVFAEMKIRAPKDITALSEFIVTGELPEEEKKEEKNEDKGEQKNVS